MESDHRRQLELFISPESEQHQRLHAPQRPRFTAPHAQRSELKASVNNALLGDL